MLFASPAANLRLLSRLLHHILLVSQRVLAYSANIVTADTFRESQADYASKGICAAHLKD